MMSDDGSAPENDIVAIREQRPARLLIVDASDMGLNPGGQGGGLGFGEL